MDILERITLLLEEKITTDELFSDCFLVDMELKPGKNLHIFLDADSAITFEKCQKMSRFLEGYIDTNGWLGEKYTLEVSSPGIGRPLKFLRQYQKNIGRNITATLLDKSQKTGTLVSATADKIALEEIVIEKDGKKKKEIVQTTEIPFETIEKTIVNIVF